MVRSRRRSPSGSPDDDNDDGTRRHRGALFRNLYRDFLTECLDYLDDTTSADIVRRGRDLFAQSAELWRTVAQLIDRSSRTGDLDGASHTLHRTADIETDAMTMLRSLSTA